MNFVPAHVQDGALQLPFVTVPILEQWRAAVADRSELIAGIRPGSFEDAAMVDPGKADEGATFDVTVDVIEWLGNEQYAFVPYDAPENITATLNELQTDLDSEAMRLQMTVALDPMIRVSSGDTVKLWLDTGRIHLFDPETGENLTRVDAEDQKAS